MLAKINRVAITNFFLSAIIGVVAGCAPAGPRALLDGKKLLEKGKYSEAVEELTKATSILTTNAQAWNYLGLAYHGAGKTTDAMKSYQQALTLDRNLVETRYNLGCLYLEQNKLDAAKNELVTFVLRRPGSASGFSKLGTAQLRAKELNAAEKSFGDALRINPQSAESFNGIGLVMLQRNRPREAAQYFQAALKQQPNYAPAVLNLAVVSHQQLNDKQTALQKYREYVALEPNSANATSVNEIIRHLNKELNPSRPAPPVHATIAAVQPAKAVNPPATNVIKVVSNTPRPVVAKQETKTNPPNIVRVDPKTNLETVRVAEPVVIKSPTDTRVISENKTAPRDVVIVEPRSSSPLSSNSIPPKTEKKGFLSAINPKNWFQSQSRTLTAPKMTAIEDRAPTPKTDPPPKPVVNFARYPYRSSIKLKTGNRAEAENIFAQGLQAQQENKFREAMTAFRLAVKTDPGFFQAHYNLGWSAFQSGELSQALASFENSLALDPDSADARYNFALALKQANYFPDSANELEKLLAKHPEEVRAHLLLGNLCAEQFNETKIARAHYLRVLELEPKHPRANDIRFWLKEHS